MNITTIVVGELETNCYILEIGDKCLIIDPGEGENEVISHLRDNNLTPLAILTTHDHQDHIKCAENLKNIYNIPWYNYKNLFEQTYNIGPFKFDVIYTKGHAESSITFIFKKEKIMFVGDFVFKGTIGRVDLPTSNYQEMIKSIEKLKTYDQDYILYPGHGLETSIKYELENNPYFN